MYVCLHHLYVGQRRHVLGGRRWSRWDKTKGSTEEVVNRIWREPENKLGVHESVMPW